LLSATIYNITYMFWRPMQTFVVQASMMAALVSAGHGDSEELSFDDEISKLVGLLRLKPGITYCEMGAGDGKFSAALGKAVMPSGNVIVTEASDSNLQAAEAKYREAGFEALQVLATDDRMGLPANTCDVLMSRMVYHMIDETVAVETYLSQLRQALKPGGRMLILDHDPDTGAVTRVDASLTMGSEKMAVVPRLQEITEFTSAGFALTKMLEWPWVMRGYALMWEHQMMWDHEMSTSQDHMSPMDSTHHSDSLHDSHHSDTVTPDTTHHSDTTHASHHPGETANLQASPELQPIHLRQEAFQQTQRVSQSVDSTGKISRAQDRS